MKGSMSELGLSGKIQYIRQSIKNHFHVDKTSPLKERKTLATV